MAFRRLFRSETARLLMMGFVVGAAGLSLVQPDNALASAIPAAVTGAAR